MKYSIVYEYFTFVHLNGGAYNHFEPEFMIKMREEGADIMMWTQLHLHKLIEREREGERAINRRSERDRPIGMNKNTAL